MKPHKDDPRLTAYVLGELSPDEAAIIAAADASDGGIRSVLGETERMCADLRSLLCEDRNHLLPRHKDAIRRAAKEAARHGKIEVLKSHRQTRKSWHIPLAAAAVIGSGIFLLTLISPPERGGKGAAASATENSVSNDSGIKAPQREGDVMKLPLEAGKRSLSLVTTAVRIEERMPLKPEIRIEEILNAFPLKAKGSAALWKGCALAAEILPCPWRPSGNLILVSLQGARDGERNLSVKISGEGNPISNHRLLGYPPSVGDTNTVSSETKIPAGGAVVLVIEASAHGSDFGKLTWTVDGTEAPPVDLVFNPETAPSDDASFATLICAFGLWLREEGKPTIDDLLVLALAREAAAENLVADRYDFITLVDQAIKLSER